MYFDKLFSELWQCYLLARKGKRNKHSVLKFDLNAPSHITKLTYLLLNKEWLPGVYNAFLVQKPVLREIFAAPFVDRIVHHFLCRNLGPTLESKFIYDSYSCQVDKGTHFAIGRAKKMARAVSDGFSKEAWVLRLDIAGYFISIRRDTLYRQVQKDLEGYFENRDLSPSYQIFKNEILQDLLSKIIFCNPTQKVYKKGTVEDWKKLPTHKSLFYSKPGCGLPIGNLTSQLFGNVYLNTLDQYIKRELKIKYYGRYVDDMLLFHSSKEELTQSTIKIEKFLKERLSLTLHPKKIQIQTVQKGSPFLGAYILPFRTYLDQRAKKNTWEAIKENKSSASLESYKGHLGHFDATRLSNKMKIPQQSKRAEASYVLSLP